MRAPGEQRCIFRAITVTARKRESLLAATEADLAKITAATRRARQPLREDQIALRTDRALRRRRVAKHFIAEIGEDHFSYARN